MFWADLTSIFISPVSTALLHITPAMMRYEDISRCRWDEKMDLCIDTSKNVFIEKEQAIKKPFFVLRKNGSVSYEA